MDGPNERYEDGAYVVVLWIIRRQHSAGIFEPDIVAEDGLLHRRRTTAITVETTTINRPNITEIHRGACPEFSVAATQGRGQQQHQQAADDPEGEAPGAPMDPVSECIHLILHVRSKIRRYGADSQTPTGCREFRVRTAPPSGVNRAHRSPSAGPHTLHKINRPLGQTYARERDPVQQRQRGTPPGQHAAQHGAQKIPAAARWCFPGSLRVLCSAVGSTTELQRTAMRIFGSLEAEIMPILWRDGQATVKQVHREIMDWRDLAYTTVMTTMERLTEKGVLKREKRGAAYVYTLAHSREEYAAQSVRQIIEQVLDGDATALVGTSIEIIAGS